MPLPTLEDLKEQIFRCTGEGYCREQVRTPPHRAVDYVFKTCPVREHVEGNFDVFTGKGKAWIARGVLERGFTYTPYIIDVIYKCTTCGLCREVCLSADGNPEQIDHPAIVEALRYDIVSRGLAPENTIRIKKLTEKYHNPYGEDHKKRLNWLAEIEIKPGGGDILYFYGCTSAYRTPEIAKATVELFKAAGVNFTVLEDEWCCGSVLLRTGHRDLFEDLVNANVEKIKDVGVSTIVTSCAGCYRTLKIDYPLVTKDFKFKVLHTVELLDELVREGSLRLSREVRKVVTYHDPCHLGRHCRVFDAPRNLLKRIPGLKFVEMKRIKEYSWCCGAGGGLKSYDNALATSMAVDRHVEAKEVNADVIVSACPFCKRNLSDAASAASKNACEVVDIVELLKNAASL